jgi:hypothetical protein
LASPQLAQVTMARAYDHARRARNRNTRHGGSTSERKPPGIGFQTWVERRISAQSSTDNTSLPPWLGSSQSLRGVNFQPSIRGQFSRLRQTPVCIAVNPPSLARRRSEPLLHLGLTAPRSAEARSTLLGGLRSRTTCRNAGSRSGDREIHGKDGVSGFDSGGGAPHTD